jgi:hypothetical protein
MSAVVTNGTDQIWVSGITAAGTYGGPQNLAGGTYLIAASTLTGTSPTAQLQKVLSDGTTVNVGTQLTTTTLSAVVQTGPGLHQLVFGGTVTAAEVSVSKIKGGI